MANIKTIIKTLDDHMQKQGVKSLAPPEANQLLERKGLLADSNSRPGLPLRKLLRAGRLPHAYKVGWYWVIPRSGK